MPASYQIREALELPGTKILMKTGRQYGKVKEQLLSADMDVVMVENCGYGRGKNFPWRRRDAGGSRILYADICER